MKLLPVLCFATIVLALRVMGADTIPLYVGTYTKPGGSQGIYRYVLNTQNGALTGGELAAEAKNPTFLALHPTGKFIYAAMENSGGAVGAFAIEPDGKLKLLSQHPSKGSGACHVWVNDDASHVFVANYGGGSVAALPIQPDGSVKEATGFVQHEGSSVNQKRQEKPHGHAIYTYAKQPFVYACDLGLDKVLIYRLGASGELTPNNPPSAPVPPGSGPRHLAFTPDGAYAYVINELLNTVSVFKHDAARGSLTAVQVISTLPADFTQGSSTAEIFVHPNGKFVYGSNRGHDSIVVYAIDQATGKLTLVEHVSTKGKGPRNFALDPEGKFLIAANQGTNDMFVFRVDASTGKLTSTGHSVELGAPVAIQFVSAR
jgi:6-phosphogluconolactonase